MLSPAPFEGQSSTSCPDTSLACPDELYEDSGGKHLVGCNPVQAGDLFSGNARLDGFSKASNCLASQTSMDRDSIRRAWMGGEPVGYCLPFLLPHVDEHLEEPAQLFGIIAGQRGILNPQLITLALVIPAVLQQE